MARILRRSVAALLLLCTVLVSASAPSQPAPNHFTNAIHATDPSASEFLPQVRLRRLHLMRPDLIPYPIAYDVVC